MRLADTPTTLIRSAPCAPDARVVAAWAEAASARSGCTASEQHANTVLATTVFTLSAALALAALLGSRLTLLKVLGIEMHARPLSERDVQQALAGLDAHEALPAESLTDSASADPLPAAALTTFVGGEPLAIFDDLFVVPEPFRKAWEGKVGDAQKARSSFLFAATSARPGEHPWLIVTKEGACWKMTRGAGDKVAAEKLR